MVPWDDGHPSPEILTEAGIRGYGPKVQYPCPGQVDTLRL
jgi:hypothetical protein